jgi:hypothetical protein
MDSRVILMVGLVLCAMGCAEKEQVNSEPMDEASKTAPEAAAPATVNESRRNASFLAHMHHHAARLDELNYALADNDLEGAVIPARWLSRHDTVDDVPSDWMPYLYGMRAEAEAVENAPDLATAGAAAERITAQCQGCHAAAGVSIQ